MSDCWPSMSQCGHNGGTKATQIQVLQPEPTPRRVRTKLGNIREIRFELARVYRLMKAGEIDTTTGTRLTYVLTQLANMTVDSQIEDRLGTLERGE